jgi:hypothetical protein
MRFTLLFMMASLIWQIESKDDRVFGHAGFDPAKGLIPRCDEGIHNRDCEGIKQGPCGGIARSLDRVTNLNAGEMFTMEWVETINHPGYFLLQFSQDGQKDMITKFLIQDQDLNLVNTIARFEHKNGGTPKTYSGTFTVPDVTCNKCVLQLVQVMEDKNPVSNYFSCADIKITKGGAPVTPPVGQPPAKPSNFKVTKE